MSSNKASTSATTSNNKNSTPARRKRQTAGEKKSISDDDKRKIAKAMKEHGSVIWKLDHPLHKKLPVLEQAYNRISDEIGLEGEYMFNTTHIIGDTRHALCNV